MTAALREKLKDYPNVRQMLEEIPQNALYIFLPSTEEGLVELEVAALAWKAREHVREQVIALQQLCGFPLRPNVPLHEVRARARVAGMKKDLLFRQYRDRPDNRGV